MNKMRKESSTNVSVQLARKDIPAEREILITEPGEKVLVHFFDDDTIFDKTDYTMSIKKEIVT